MGAPHADDREVGSTVSRARWEAVWRSDPDALPTQQPRWMDALCSGGSWVDATRSYRAADGRRIVLPLARPGLVATAIFAVIVTYNEFLFALVLTSTPDSETMPVGAATLIGRINIDWGAMSAAGVVGAVPIVVFALLVQRHLVRGLTMGAVK